MRRSARSVPPAVRPARGPSACCRTTLSRNDPPFPSPASAAAPPVQDNGFSPSSKRSERPVHRLPEQRRVVRAVIEAPDFQVVAVRAFEQVQRGDRTRVVSGQSVSVGVEPWGRRLINKKKTK